MIDFPPSVKLNIQAPESAAVPSVAFVNADGTAADTQAWVFNLADGGKSITFGYARGTILIIR